MLSCWQYWDATNVPGSALSQWLVGIDVEHGLDGFSFPTFLKQNFNGQEAADLYQAVHPHTLEDLAEQGSASWRSELSPMSIPWKPSLQSIVSRLQGACRTSCPLTSGLRRLSGMVTPRLLPLSKLRLNGLMPKIILATLVNVVVEVESQYGLVVWSSAQKCPPTLATDSYPLRLIVVPGRKSNGTSLRLCTWKQRDSEVGTCHLYPLGYLDRIG